MDIIDSSDQHAGTLVAQVNQSNSVVKSINETDSTLSSTSSLSHSFNAASKFTLELDNSIDNQNTVIVNVEQQAIGVVNNQIAGNSNNEHQQLFGESIKSNQVKHDDQPVSEDQMNKSHNSVTIEELGLNLDYHPQTNLDELEQSITSLSTATQSEAYSIPSSNSRASSPNGRASLRSQPPIQRANTSESNLLANEHHHADSKDDQARFFAIERKNLMHLAFLIINNLIATNQVSKTLECLHNTELYDFFSITEQILKHGLKARKGLIFGKKELWNVLECIEHNRDSQIIEIVQNVRELPVVKTNNGRVKAFLRLAFVHKVFNDIFVYLIGNKELLAGFYEEGSFILSDEIDEFLMKTQQLKEFEFSWCPKDDCLDSLSNLIDMTNYLVNGDRTTKEIVYKVNINKSQLKGLIEEKQFYEAKSRQFRNKILFYHNRIKELGIESLFQDQHSKSPSRLDFLGKKFNELFQSPMTSSVGNSLDQPNPDVLSLQEDIATLKAQLEIELSNRLSKEAALEYIESDVLVKQDENIVMRHQIEEVKQVNDDLCAKVGELVQMNSDLNAKIVSLTSKNQMLVSNVTELQRTLVATEAKYSHLSITEKQNGKQFEQTQQANESLKAKLLEVQEEKNNLQKKLDDNIERNSTVLTELNIAHNRLNDYPSIKKKHDVLLKRCLEYEQTCEEIGQKLAAAQLEIENLKEQTIPYSDATWKSDQEVDKCEGCSALFSIKIRRHHCRNCGGIFCAGCSDRKMPLPADAKPCRVCDNCHTKLMSRYNG